MCVITHRNKSPSPFSVPICQNLCLLWNKFTSYRDKSGTCKFSIQLKHLNCELNRLNCLKVNKLYFYHSYSTFSYSLSTWFFMYVDRFMYAYMDKTRNIFVLKFWNLTVHVLGRVRLQRPFPFRLTHTLQEVQELLLGRGERPFVVSTVQPEQSLD